MENDFFLNSGIPPSLVHFDSNPSIPTWQQLSSAMEVQAPELDSFQNWEKSVSDRFDSELMSSNESFVIRELIGKLGIVGNSEGISQPLFDRESEFQRSKLNSPCKSMTMAEFSADPGFAERAARFSCFGNRSFNGRHGHEFADFRSNHSKISRVSSSPSLKPNGSEDKNSSPLLEPNELANSQDESTLSEQIPNAGFLKASAEMNSRKRRANSKQKLKEPSSSSPSPTTTRIVEGNEKSTPKRCKTAESNGNEKKSVETEEELKEPEPPKDYIHVRARRGQATDSHSLAERVRREKISERMKLLQDLVPGCNKVTGKALMLDEIINYVQSLQHQVEFLSMKLASVNTRVDFNMDSLISKEMYQSGNPLGNPQISPLDSSASAWQKNPSSSYGTARASSSHCSIPLNSVFCHGYGENASQYPTFGEDDLQTIVQMGFVQNQNGEIPLQSQNFNLGADQVSQMKVEL